MNLPMFLNEVDVLTSQLSHEELEGFVHEIARTLPEGEREYFLSTLKSFGGRGASRKIAKDDGYNALLTDIGTIKKKLAEINDGERCLDSEYNEEWDDWYNSDADEVLFMDHEGVLDDVNEAMELIHRCVDMEAYKEGCELAEILSVLEVTADGDYNDYAGAPLSVHGLAEERLLSYDFEKMVRECLYLTYMGNELADRPEEIFCMMENFECHDMSLEQILQSGNEELPQFAEFLVRWIAYLGERKGQRAGCLLREAQTMLRDEDEQIENARKYVADHPSLYKQLLEMKLESVEEPDSVGRVNSSEGVDSGERVAFGEEADSSENEKMLQLGMEALDKIPCSYVIRSEIALLAAEYACKLQDKAAMETCWLEAFRSDSTVTNYLRVKLQTENWKKYEDAVNTICEQVYKDTEEKRKSGNIVSDRNKQRENSLYKNEYCMILFFEERFDSVFQIGMNEKNAVGWSSTFMKQGLALFLLLLYNGEDLPVGLRSMLNEVSFASGFKADEYFKGIEVREEANDDDALWKLFRQWKRNVQISDEQREAWLDKIEKWIELRVAGIMNGNHRNYYGECASYIAAFGEVQESMGILWGKERIMERYKGEYSRRRAFHQELRGYGMEK